MSPLGDPSSGIADGLLNEAIARQGRRIAAISQPWNRALLSTITPADISADLHLGDQLAHDERAGQYL